MITIEETPTRDYFQDGDTYTSRWVSAGNPIIFKFSNTKFPFNSEDIIQSFSSVDDDFGLARLTIDVPDPGSIVPGGQIKILAGTYAGTHTVKKYWPEFGQVTINTSFITDESGDFVKAFQGYANKFQIFVGIRQGHPWAGVRPISLKQTRSIIPDVNNEAKLDIQDVVVKDLNTKNDFRQPSFPNDLNIWTNFRVNYAETYQDAVGNVGDIVNVLDNAQGSSGALIFYSGSVRIAQVGDYVQLLNWDSTLFDMAIVRVLGTGTLGLFRFLILDMVFSAYDYPGDYAQLQKYDITKQQFTTTFTEEGNNYYAVHSKYRQIGNAGGVNLGRFVNNNNTIAQNLTKFVQKPFFVGQYDDFTAIISRELVDSLTADESIALKVIQVDINDNTVSTENFTVNNQGEGVYRLPYAGEIVRVPTMQIMTEKNGTFSALIVKSGPVTEWEFEDGESIFSNNPSKTLNGDLQTVKLYINTSLQVATFVIQSQNLVGNIAFPAMPLLSDLRLNNNVKLENIDLENVSGNLSNTDLSNTGVRNVNVSNANVSGFFRLNNTPKLESIAFNPSNSGTVTNFDVTFSGIEEVDTTFIDISPEFNVNNNSKLTSVKFKPDSPFITILRMERNNNLVFADLSTANVRGTLRFFLSAKLERVLFKNYASTEIVNTLLLDQTAYNNSIDLSMFQFVNAVVRMSGSSGKRVNFTNITFSSAANTINDLWLNDNNIAGSFDFSTVQITGSTARVRGFKCYNLTGLKFAATSLFKSFDISETIIKDPEIDSYNAGAFEGCSFFSIKRENTSASQIANPLTAAEVNKILIDLDANVGVSPTPPAINTWIIGQGPISLNAAPTGAGITAKNSLISKGYNVLTN